MSDIIEQLGDVANDPARYGPRLQRMTAEAANEIERLRQRLRDGPSTRPVGRVEDDADLDLLSWDHGRPQ